MIDVSVRCRVNKRSLLSMSIFFLLCVVFYLLLIQQIKPRKSNNQSFDQVKPFRMTNQEHIKSPCLLRLSKDTFYIEMVSLV